MERGAKSAKAKVEARPITRKPWKVVAPTGLQVEQRLVEALEQHAAISEILQVISSSPGDVTPVLATVAERAARLCNASFAQVLLVEGNVLRPTVAYWADAGADEESDDSHGVKRTWPLTRSMMIGRAVLDCEIIHHADVLPLLDSEYPDSPRAKQQELGYRAVLAVPLMREGGATGVIFIFRREPRAFSPEQIALVQTFARQAAIAIENARLFNETKEALDQQRASGEVLAAISSSIANTKPVFDRILASCERLFAGNTVGINLIGDDGLVRLGAYHGPGREELAKILEVGTGTGSAIRDRRIVHFPDVAHDEGASERTRRASKAIGARGVIFAPMLWEGNGIGVIFVGRDHVGPFSNKEIALLKTFADQAVIAIQNARLFNETKEALEQQTATSEILRVISRSPTDAQPVFDAIAANAAQLCGATDAIIRRVDGNSLRLVAHHGLLPGVSADSLMPLDRSSVMSRAVVDRQTVHIDDLAAQSYGEFPVGRDLAKRFGYRTVLATPLLRDGVPIGVIGIRRLEVRPFSGKQIKLLETFADQAVIAIENDRLFKELEARNRDLTEALEHQTATSDILQVISSSPTDVQPVFEVISSRAGKLCDAEISMVTRVDGEQIHLAAIHGVNEEARETIRRVHPMPLNIQTATARAIRGRGVVHISDVMDDPLYGRKDAATVAGWRRCLAVPMLREGQVIGAIFVARRNPGLFADSKIELLKTFADQAVIAIENVRLFKETKEALERQSASAEVLAAISSSIADTEPVFDRILASCEHLFAGKIVGINVVGEDGLLRVAAYQGQGREEVEKTYPAAIDDESASGVVMIRREVLHLPDVDGGAHVPPVTRRRCLAMGIKAAVVAPLLWEGKGLGSIFVGRDYAGPFSDNEIALLQTFADQAVIAIQNARLFNETKEALEQQQASGEVLAAISSSIADTTPVFDKILASCERLFAGTTIGITLVDNDGLIRLGVFHGTGREQMEKIFPAPVDGSTGSSLAILRRDIVHYPDVVNGDAVPDKVRRGCQATGVKSIIFAPMLWEGNGIGTIFVGRGYAGPFSEKEIALLKTFADQAVIAIENARLFRETKEALEQQTATSEILRVISRSQRDVQPVFDTIAAAALKLCGASSALVTTFDGELVRLAALAKLRPEGSDAIRAAFPRPPSRETGATRAILMGSTVEIPDVLEDPEYATRVQALAGDFRSVLAIPLMRDGSPIGAITVGRPEQGPFAEKQIALLKTFADQAVIAIENVRLFTELEARTHQLTRSVEELKALGEVGQAVSSTLDLETVLSTIVSRAAQLAGMDGGAIFEYDETPKAFSLRATDNLPDELVAALGAAPIPKGEGAIGQLAVTGEPVQICDIVEESGYQSRVRDILVRIGSRSLLAVPLLREDRLLGGLVVNRKSIGEFAPEVIELLKTFATQSALAIQNARLFREIEQKSRELEAASRHKSEFLANMSHELRTPLNAIIGFSEVLSERLFGEINEKQAEYIGDILQSGQHLLSLINDILDLSKIEAGRMELELSDFDLPGTIENTLTLVRERAMRRGIELGRTVDERLGMVRADERKVKQVLLNLLSNALKFTPEGGKIDVRAALSKGVVEITVMDTGVGIAPEDQHKVFEEFRQVGTASKKVEGTGLGLAISRKFIELHGGRIWVNSQVGAGSTFAFTLPLQ